MPAPTCWVMGAAPLGGLLGGSLAATSGLRPNLWILGAGMMASAGPLLFSPLIKLKDTPYPEALHPTP